MRIKRRKAGAGIEIFNSLKSVPVLKAIKIRTRWMVIMVSLAVHGCNFAHKEIFFINSVLVVFWKWFR